MEKTTDRLYLNPETREKIQAILELDGYVELELISKMGLDGMSGLAQQKKQAAADGVTSGSAKGTTSGSAKGATSKLSKFAKGTSSGLPKGVTSGSSSAKGTTSGSAKGATSGSAEEVTDEESKPGSCILTQFTPLQLVAKRPGHKIPTVIWESKLKHSARSVRPLRRFY